MAQHTGSQIRTRKLLTYPLADHVEIPVEGLVALRQWAVDAVDSVLRDAPLAGNVRSIPQAPFVGQHGMLLQCLLLPDLGIVSHADVRKRKSDNLTKEIDDNLAFDHSCLVLPLIEQPMELWVGRSLDDDREAVEIVVAQSGKKGWWESRRRRLAQ